MPLRLASTTVFHCSTVRSSRGTAGAPVPALLKSRSSRPNVSFVFANSAFTDAGSPTSVGTTSVRLLHCDAVSCSASLRRPASTTDQPSRDSATDDARPIPDPAPVTIAILSDDAMRVSAFRWDVGHRDGTPVDPARAPSSAAPWTAPHGLPSSGVPFLDRRREDDHADEADGARHPERQCRRHPPQQSADERDRKSTRLNSSHLVISYAVFCLKKKKKCTYRQSD